MTSEVVPAAGLKKNAVSFASNAVIGIASTAPAYSLASALGVIAGTAAFATPAIIIVAFIPMLFVATAYFYLNRADPDCGTVFSWATRTMGPSVGWVAGWALIATNIVVIPSLAVIEGRYSLQLLGYTQPSALAVTAVGVLWIALMTAICYFGIELSARTQQVLLAIELIALFIFAAVALARAYGGSGLPESASVAWSWFDPFATGSADKFVEAFLAAVFVYWGWDAGVSINEETENPRTAPGRAAIASTLLLLVVYLLVAVAAIAFAGPQALSTSRADIFASIGTGVLGPGFDTLLVIAVLTSASAATQTTILPASRTVLSMARTGAMPKALAKIHPRYLTPDIATLLMGAISIAWYAGLSILSQNVLEDSILALGLCIAFYYCLNGLACVILCKGEILKSARNFVLMGLFPAAGALTMLFLFIRSCVTLAGTGATAIFGLGTPLVIGLGALFTGFLLMALARLRLPDFFRESAQPPAGGESSPFKV